jgi:hypothetical protein
VSKHRRETAAQTAVKHFADDHFLKSSPVLLEEAVAIESAAAALDAVNRAYAGLDHVALADPAIGLLLNLLHRNIEHVEGAIAACATGFGASAEVVARAAVETSINITYILSGRPQNRGTRLRAYFQHYLRETKRQVSLWRKQIEDLTPAERQIHIQASQQRQDVLNSLQDLVVQLLGSEETKWPTAAQRFEEIGRALDYRTLYVRLSAETHADAEETLRYLVGKLQNDPALLDQMALETVMFSRFLVYSAAAIFIDACYAYATSYSLSEALPRIKMAQESVIRKISEISHHVGAGI